MKIKFAESILNISNKTAKGKQKWSFLPCLSLGQGTRRSNHFPGQTALNQSPSLAQYQTPEQAAACGGRSPSY